MKYLKSYIIFQSDNNLVYYADVNWDGDQRTFCGYNTGTSHLQDLRFVIDGCKASLIDKNNFTPWSYNFDDSGWIGGTEQLDLTNFGIQDIIEFAMEGQELGLEYGKLHGETDYLANSLIKIFSLNEGGGGLVLEHRNGNRVTLVDRGAYKIVFQKDGNIVGYSEDGNPIWSTLGFGIPPIAKVQLNGVSVIFFDKDGKVIWSQIC